MIYSLILILGTGVTTVGNYSDAGSCQAQLGQFREQRIQAACVQQQSPEQAMIQAQGFFQTFLSLIPKE
jgi:hypothetical protein